MPRPRILISAVGVALTVLLFAVIGVLLWVNGGKMFSPGPLTAQARSGTPLGGYTSHADFESDCSLCHQLFRTGQAELCTACHLNIQEQIDSTDGLHAQFTNVFQCRDCHPDHRGRDFDPLSAAFSEFDHDLSGFSLVRHQVNYDVTPMECIDCHLGEDFVASDESCRACHGVQDAVYLEAHTLEAGASCLACHDGADRMLGFDHAETGFSLDGEHAAASCSACHEVDQFVLPVQDCVACHAEPQVHAGIFPLECAQCHTAEAWRPAVLDGESFEHAIVAGFSLARHAVDYGGTAITCVTCHQDDVRTFEMQTCIACHGSNDRAFMSAHINQFGLRCLDCHDGVDRMEGFDHDQVFPLRGRHAEIRCTDCHAGQRFSGTPRDCVVCHAEPSIHAGLFGLQCQNCHIDRAWVPAQLTIHAFPLEHGDPDEVACATCHTQSYVVYTCYGCHEHQPEPIAESHGRAGISPDELPNCAGCHPDGLIADTP